MQQPNIIEPSPPLLEATSTSRSINTIPSDEDLLMYLTFDLRVTNLTALRKIFPRQSKLKSISIPKSIRGHSRLYWEIISKCREFQSFSHEEQKRVRDFTWTSASCEKKAEYVANIAFMNERSTKIAAIESHPRGRSIAIRAGFFDSVDENGRQLSDEELKHDEDLACLLRCDWSSANIKEFAAIFPRKRNAGGKVIWPPPSIRGYSLNYRELVRKARDYMAMSRDEQKEEKEKFTNLDRNAKKTFTYVIDHVNSAKYKDKAVREHPRGRRIAERVGYEPSGEGDDGRDNNDNFDLSLVVREESTGQDEVGAADDENDESDPHTGLASAKEALKEFAQRRVKETKKECRKRKAKEAPIKITDLCQATSIESENRVIKQVSEFLDTNTIVQTGGYNAHSNAPLRTGLFISLCETNDNSNGGGRRALCDARREKPLITVVGNSKDETHHVFKSLMAAFGHDGENQQENYDVVTIYRKKDQTLTETANEYLGEKKKARQNPSRKRRALREISNSILERNSNIISHTTRLDDNQEDF